MANKAPLKGSNKKPGIDPVVLQRFAGPDPEARVTTPAVRTSAPSPSTSKLAR